jgi:putative FmdB family regulatory protein
MPRYDYRCTACGQEVEVMHGIHDSGPTTCEHCGGAMRKALSAPAIHFRGSGWAKKDAAASARKATAKSGSSKSSDPSSDSTGESAKNDTAKSGKSGSSESGKSDSSPGSASGSETKTTSTTGSTAD